MMNHFEDLFTNVEDICREFQTDADELKGAKVYAAMYRYEDYSGSAMVLFEKDGKLFSVHGGHCSCYGLEGQWKPEEETWANILHWLDKGTMYNEFSDELRAHLRRVAVRRVKKELK
jgi:hypothetical protein